MERSDRTCRHGIDYSLCHGCSLEDARLMSRFPLNGFTLDDEFVLFFGIVTNMATAECLWMDDDDRG